MWKPPDAPPTQPIFRDATEGLTLDLEAAVTDAYADAFMPHIWVGDDDVGIAWFAESDEAYSPEHADRVVTDLARVAHGDREPAVRVAHAEQRVVLAGVPAHGGADLLDDLPDLIDMSPVRRRPAAPLDAIDRTEFAILVGPLIPYRYAVVLEVANVAVAAEKPQQLMDD